MFGRDSPPRPVKVVVGLYIWFEESTGSPVLAGTRYVWAPAVQEASCVVRLDYVLNGGGNAILRSLYHSVCDTVIFRGPELPDEHLVVVDADNRCAQFLDGVLAGACMERGMRVHMLGSNMDLAYPAPGSAEYEATLTTVSAQIARQYAPEVYYLWRQLYEAERVVSPVPLTPLEEEGEVEACGEGVPSYIPTATMEMEDIPMDDAEITTPQQPPPPAGDTDLVDLSSPDEDDDWDPDGDPLAYARRLYDTPA